ncbi:MAG: TrkA family potassium uptake protein [Mycoplasma sp.]|nr:TrkA family potassium uptake protein [Mycoplasma sp.]
MVRVKKNKSSICVIGIGRFGTAVVDELIEQNISVLAIDTNEKELLKYSNSPLVTTIAADAADIQTLQSLGVNEINTVIIGAPNNIEVVAALLELNIEHIIARAASSRHARVLKQIGVDLIVRPETETGARTALIATNSNFIKFSKTLTEIGNGFVIGSSNVLNDDYVNIQLKDLKFNYFGITLVLVKRGDDSFLPKADTKFEIGDELMVVGKTNDVTKFFGLLNEDNPIVVSRNKRRKWIKSS